MILGEVFLLGKKRGSKERIQRDFFFQKKEKKRGKKKILWIEDELHLFL